MVRVRGKNILTLAGSVPPNEVATVPNEIAERLRAFASSIESNHSEWQGILDSLGAPTGNIDDYLLAFKRH